MRPGRRRRRDPRPRPDERPLRDGQPATATPTGRSPTRRTCPAYWAFGWSGKWDTLPARARDLDPVGPALPGRPRARRAAVRRERARGGARVRLGHVAVHAVRLELEHERRDPAGAARSGASTSRRRQFARGAFVALSVVGQVRAAAAAAALDRVPGGPAPRGPGRPLRGRLPRRRRWLAFSILFLEPSPSTPRGCSSTARSGLQIGRALAVLALGLGPVPREGAPRPPLASQRVLEGAARRLRARARLVAEAPLRAPARRADRVRC